MHKLCTVVHDRLNCKYDNCKTIPVNCISMFFLPFPLTKENVYVKERAKSLAQNSPPC